MYWLQSIALGEQINENQFLVNQTIIDLPTSGSVTRRIAEAVCDLIIYGARHGAGESQECKGMIVLAGSQDQFKDFGYVQGNNKFEGKDIYVQNWRDSKSFVLNCFLQDLGIFIDGSTGKILADRYKVDLRTRDADQNGGSKHVSASAAGKEGCLAIKCSEDCCLLDGVGKGELKVFSGTKTPTNVPVGRMVENMKRSSATKDQSNIEASVKKQKTLD